MVSTLALTHKIVNTNKPDNMYRKMVSPYPYQTRGAAGGQLRAYVGTTRGRDRTALTTRTFQYQSISLYNSIPIIFRSYGQDQFKSAIKTWVRRNV